MSISDYDEVIAVSFIQNYLPQELKDRFNEDDIYYFLDLLCEFYEKNDYLEEDDEEKEERELIDFIIQQSAKDVVGDFTREEVLMFLLAESAYTDTLNMEE
ncbi:MAG: hypothetical protein LBJ72_06410 [Dysgonamonadaceae bacterium]|jgi:hypothetical protein|nr:hypothetical protein [Dysgonamonadaceae bacterium]